MDFSSFSGAGLGFCGTAELGLGFLLERRFEPLELLFHDLHYLHRPPFNESGYVLALAPLPVAQLACNELVSFCAALPLGDTCVTILQNRIRNIK